MPTPTVNDVHIDTAMTQISIAYKNAAYIAEQVFPVVTVQKVSDKYWVFPKDDWFRDDAAIRAPGTRARSVDYALTTGSYVCIEHALKKSVTDEERANSDAPLRPDTTATNYVTSKILLALERRVAAVVTTCGNWSNASNPGTAWTDDTSDVFNDIDNLKNAIMQNTGAIPNVCIIGQNVWKRLQRHPDVLSKIQYVERGVLRLPTFAELIGVEKVLVGTTIYNSAKEGATASMSYIWGDNLWMGYVAPTPELNVPSAGYTFRWGDQIVRRYREDQERQDVLEVSHYTAEQVTASDAGGGMFDCV